MTFRLVDSVAIGVTAAITAAAFGTMVYEVYKRLKENDNDKRI